MIDNTKQNEERLNGAGASAAELITEQTYSVMRVRTESLLESRLDLRGAPTLSFAASPNDPVCCAMSFSESARGCTLTVHVADVTEFSEPGTPLDAAAKETGEGTPGEKYLFPPILINETFNLVPGEDRPALSVILDFNTDGDVTGVSFDESVVRVDRCCLFSEIDALEINGDSSAVMELRRKYSPCVPLIDGLYALAARLRAQRRELGGMVIPKYEARFNYNDNARPVSFTRTPEPDSRAMLRELLIFAGAALGEHCRRERYPVMYTARRYYPRPFLKKLSAAFGLDVILPQVGFNEVSTLCEAASGAGFEPVLADELRLYMPPRYYTAEPAFNSISGTKTTVSFTKPTLRYADMENHRTLKHIISARRKGLVGANATFEERFLDNSLRAALKQSVAATAPVMSRISELAAQHRTSEELEKRASLLSSGSFVRGYVYELRGSVYRILLENNVCVPYRGDAGLLPRRSICEMRYVRTSRKEFVELF